MTKRTLALRREPLTELTPEQLSGVVAGARDEATRPCPDHTYHCVTGAAICETRIVCV